jgi:hypothetical protein
MIAFCFLLSCDEVCRIDWGVEDSHAIWRAPLTWSSLCSCEGVRSDIDPSSRPLSTPPHLRRTYPASIPLLQRPLRNITISSPCRLWIWRVQCRVVRRIRGQNLHLNRSIALPVVTRRCAHSQVVVITFLQARRDINLLESALEDLQSGEGLVEGDFMAGFVDAEEGEETGLLDLAMDDAVAGCDVREAGFRVSGGVNNVRDDLAAEPVAVVVPGRTLVLLLGENWGSLRIAIVEHDLDACSKQLPASLNRTGLTVVVTRVTEC